MASVWVEGIENLNKVTVDLSTAGSRISAKASAVVRRSGQQLVAQAQRFAPVDTGALRSSIGVDFTGDGRSTEMLATAGPTVSYAVFQEFGSSRIAPRAFMGPALDRVSGDFVAALEALADPLQ